MILTHCGIRLKGMKNMKQMLTVITKMEGMNE